MNKKRMSSTISLTASTRTCSVNTGEAERIQSDRFENPNSMVCIAWNGTDLTGREVSPDSFYTKTAGCDSAEDRVLVENDLRPKYFNYITLGAEGVDGQIYGNVDAQMQVDSRQKFIQSRSNITGKYGSTDFSRNLTDSGSCSINAYEKAMAQMSQLQRSQGRMNSGFRANSDLRAAGFRK